jgi:hypothetical protein
MKTFKFGRPYKTPIYDIGIESFAQSVGLSRDMIQRLEQKRIIQREEAADRQRESIARYHQSLIRERQIQAIALKESIEQERERVRVTEMVEWRTLQHREQQ